MKKKYLNLLLVVFIFLAGCANKGQVGEIEESKEVEPYSIIIPIENEEQDPARQSDPKALTELLNYKNTEILIENSVSLLRPKAIKESAQLVGVQTAIKWRYEQLLTEVAEYAYLLDTAFNFAPLLMVNDQEVLVMPPVITKAEEAMRLENRNLVTTAKSVYEILESAKYVSSIPNWRAYMMVNAFPVPEQPNLAVLPRNSKEIILWQEAIRKAWAEGIAEAEELFIVNINRLVRDYKGITLYHLLVAKNYLAQFEMSSSPAISNIDGNKMFLKQKIFRITKPTKFQVPKE